MTMETNNLNLEERLVAGLEPKRMNRKREKKKKKKGCCTGCACCCASGDKVADTDTEVNEETEQESQAEEQKTGCCSCCRRKKKKRRRVRPKKRTGRCLGCCKRVTTFAFSHIGLCSLVVAYSVLGGFIFMKLEAPHEVVERNNVKDIRKQQVQLLWNITLELNVLYEKNWTQLAEQVLVDFQKKVFDAAKNRGWDGKDGESELQWSFAGALLYSVTVITTIGYGHIAPKTDYGRLVTIFYALFGIPLTLLCLANLGSFFGDCFRCLYKHICRGLMWLCCPPQARGNRLKKNTKMSYKKDRTVEEEGNPLRGKSSVDSDGVEVTMTVEEEEAPMKEEPVRVPMFVSLMIICSYIFGGAVIFSLWEEEWDYLIGSYFCFITLSTIGFGDYVPGAGPDSWANQEKLIICAFYLVFGLSLIAMCFNLMQEEVRAKCAWLGKKLGILDEEKTCHD